MKTTNKTLIALAISMAAFGATAQVDRAASEATEAAQHRADQMRAEGKAANSGPVGKAVNNTKAEVHKKMAEHDEKEAREALGVDGKRADRDIKPGQAATDAKDAARHKMEQKRAEDKAANSGPVGKAVNNTKAEYHKNMADHNAKEAREALGGKDVRRDTVTVPGPATKTTNPGELGPDATRTPANR